MLAQYTTSFGAFGAFGAASLAEVKTLQQTLKNVGKTGGNVTKVNGAIDGYTLAAMYEVIRDQAGPKGGAMAALISQGASSAIQTVFQKLQDLDAKLSKVPLISLSIPALLRDSSKISLLTDVVDGTCSAPGIPGCSTAREVASKIRAAIQTFWDTMSNGVPTINKVMRFLVPSAAPEQPPGAPTAEQPPGGATSLAINKGALLRNLTKVQVGPTAQKADTAQKAGASSTTASSAAQGKFVGCLYRYNKTRKKYVIYCRSNGLGVATINGTCLYGSCDNLGADAVTPPPPSGYTETAAVDSPADTGGSQSAGEEDVVLYKKPWFWAAIGGVVVVGAGGVFLWRRKKAAAPSGFGRVVEAPAGRGLRYMRNRPGHGLGRYGRSHYGMYP